MADKMRKWEVSSVIRVTVVTRVAAATGDAALEIAEGRELGQLWSLQAQDDVEKCFVVVEEPTWSSLDDDSTVVEELEESSGLERGERG